MNPARSLARLLDVAAEPRALRYLLTCRRPSLASYGICQAVRSLVGEPATVFDVGANQGQFAGAVSWWFPGARIVSFEPSPKSFRLLQQNTARIPHLRLVQTALGDRVGQLEFFENEYSHASSPLPVSDAQKAFLPETARTRKITVPVNTLDAFAAGEDWPRPLLLKLDVQGFERQVLVGARRFLAQVDYLMFESSFIRLYEGEALFEEMYKLVSDSGFEIVAPVGFLEDPHRVLLQADLLWRRKATVAGTPQAGAGPAPTSR